MAHRTTESSELLYWCKPCRDVTLHLTVVNNDTRCTCTVCHFNKPITQATANGEAQACAIAAKDVPKGWVYHERRTIL